MSRRRQASVTPWFETTPQPRVRSFIAYWSPIGFSSGASVDALALDDPDVIEGEVVRAQTGPTKRLTSAAFCNVCGAELPAGAAFCIYCAAPAGRGSDGHDV